MAYELNYWMMVGEMDHCIKTIHIARKEDIAGQKLIENRPLHTDLITLGHYQEIWKSPSYISLDERASKPVQSTSDIKYISPIEMVKAVHKLAEFYASYSASNEGSTEQTLYKAKMLVTIFANGLNPFEQKTIAQILNNWPTK